MATNCNLRFSEFSLPLSARVNGLAERKVNVAELRRLKRRLDWLETFVTVLDTQLRTQGLRIEMHLEECEPGGSSEREAMIRDAMGPQDARLYQVMRLLHEIAARQDEQAAGLADLARFLRQPSEEHAEHGRERS